MHEERKTNGHKLETQEFWGSHRELAFAQVNLRDKREQLGVFVRYLLHIYSIFLFYLCNAFFLVSFFGGGAKNFTLRQLCRNDCDLVSMVSCKVLAQQVCHPDSPTMIPTEVQGALACTDGSICFRMLAFVPVMVAPWRVVPPCTEALFSRGCSFTESNVHSAMLDRKATAAPLIADGQGFLVLRSGV